ncbi:MAG: hypothetical protein IPK48_15000 [Gammaproteobacteria bacterium]|nr:hypothetical protein [Gammaproteobacteria bacterium]
MSWKDLVEGGFIIAGSPDTVRERDGGAGSRGLRVGNIFCLMHIGDMPLKKNQILDAAVRRKVMPKLRNVWPEYADDTRFWCQPLTERATRPRVRLQRRQSVATA